MSPWQIAIKTLMAEPPPPPVEVKPAVRLKEEGERICDYCGTPYKPLANNQRFCQSRCCDLYRYQRVVKMKGLKSEPSNT